MRRRLTLNLASLPLASVLIFGFPAGGAFAADEKPAIEEIIVTALKREQALSDVPISISAFTGDYLESIGANNLTDFLGLVPGVSITDLGAAEQQVYIRGMSSLYGDPAVGYYLDEVPFVTIGTTLTPDVRSFDLERVEVLRGPQGTLYGSSSLGGTVRILTKDPEFNEFHGKADLIGSSTHGGGNNYGIKAALNLPLIDDTLALRVVGTTEDFSGWIDAPLLGLKDTNDTQFDTLRAKLRWAPRENVELILGAWTYSNDVASSSNATDDGLWVGATLQPTTRDYDLFSAALSVNLDSFDIISSTSFMDYDAELGPTSSRVNEIFSQEVRLSSNYGDSPWFWTTGAIYSDVNTKFDFVPLGLRSTQDTKSKTWAVYGELSYQFTEQLEGTAGLRYYDDTRSRHDTVAGQVDIFLEDSYSDVSPRLNLAWRPNEDVMVYGNIAKGFRSGQHNPGISLFTAEQIGISIPESLSSETAWSYEIGTKIQFADGRVSLESAVYYIDWTDLLTVVIVNPFPALGAFLTAGKATALGLDLGLTVEPVEGLTFTIGGNVNQSEYGEDVSDAFGFVYRKGDQIQLFPEYTVTASANYGWDIGSDWRGMMNVNAQQVAPRKVSFGSLGLTQGDTVTYLNARIGVEKDRWGLFLFADNLFDDDSRITGAFDFVHSPRLRPRTVGLNLQFRH